MVLAFLNRTKSYLYTFWTGYVGHSLYELEMISNHGAFLRHRKKPESEASEPLVSTNVENTTATNGEVIEISSKEQWHQLVNDTETKVGEDVSTGLSDS